jgi:hypothetical protein
MKVRKDCPFAKLTEEDKDAVLDMAQWLTIDKLADQVEIDFKLETSTSGMRRYLVKLRRERQLQEAREAEEDLAAFAELGKNSKSRDAALELARQKLCEVAVEATEPEKLTEVMRVLGDEKAREHEQTMRERAMALAEENAKIGWRKLELQQARTALALLPAIRAILMEGEGTAEERLARAKIVLTHTGGTLLLEGGRKSE